MEVHVTPSRVEDGVKVLPSPSCLDHVLVVVVVELPYSFVCLDLHRVVGRGHGGLLFLLQKVGACNGCFSHRVFPIASRDCCPCSTVKNPVVVVLEQKSICTPLSEA